jgi:Fe-S-cluster-containing dehydrogenase component
MAKKVFVIDIAKCNGCHNCQVVCKDEHVGNDWSPIAKPQPEVGQFWLELTERVRGTVPKVKVAYRPHLCMHCDDAPCIESCKVEGALYKRPDAGDHRRCQMHRLQELRGRVPLRHHLLQREPEPRPKMHGMRPSTRRRVG